MPIRQLFVFIARSHIEPLLSTLLCFAALSVSVSVSATAADLEQATAIPEALRAGVPANWKSLAEKNGWKYYQYTSTYVLGSFDGSKRRLLIVVPDDKGFEKWIQFVVPKAGAADVTKADHIDMVSFPKKFFNESYFRKQYVKPAGISQFVEKPKPDNCVSCHAGALRVIKPTLAVPGESNIYLGDLNRMIMNRNADTARQSAELEPLGPNYGERYNCKGCHTPDNGSIHAGYSRQFLRHKMVDKLEMPPGLLRDEKYAKLRSMINRIKDLSPQDKKELNPIESADFAYLISRLGSIGKASYQDIDIALDQLQEVRAQQELLYNKIISEFEEAKVQPAEQARLEKQYPAAFYPSPSHAGRRTGSARVTQ